jgi:hypothetical protein
VEVSRCGGDWDDERAMRQVILVMKGGRILRQNEGRRRGKERRWNVGGRGDIDTLVLESESGWKNFNTQRERERERKKERERKGVEGGEDVLLIMIQRNPLCCLLPR